MMLGKIPQPMIGRLSELFISGKRTNLSSDNISSSTPRSPPEHKIQSPRGLKNYDHGGVGLGIVAALEKSSSRSLMTRSDPIPVGSTDNSGRLKGGFEGMEMECLEDNYTYVTSHEISKSYTKVYYDAGELGKISEVVGIVSMAKELPPKFDMEVSLYPTSNFLSSCHLCQKKLHGRDIYMYRGEKAFCSVDCRSMQIMVDEHREKCRSEVLTKSAEVSTSPYTPSPIFSTGILAI